MNFALETRKLVKTFGGVHAVDHLSIQIKKGDITGIIGPNGSGKTTLTNVLTGVHGIDGGVVIVGGEKERKSLLPHDVYELGITRTFQNVRLFEQVPVIDNVLIALTKRTVLGSLFQRHTKFHEAQAKEILERVGLWAKRNALAKELSYGQRKLLEIARAIATDANIVLFDEPFAGLFPEMVKTVSGILKELRVGEKTVILIEHDMALIRELCDHVIVMEAGKLLAEGKPDEVLKNPKVIEAYLGA
jgi:branched-chain amino acid transport system ATP-binding protein